VKLLATWSLFEKIPQLIGSITAPYWANKFKSKARALSLATLIGGPVLVLKFFLIPIFGLPALLVLAIPLGYSAGVFQGMVYAVIPDITEVGQLRTGIRMDGLMSSFISFTNKLGVTLGSSGIIAILGLVGYVPNAPTQNTAVLLSLKSGMFLLPGIMMLIISLMFQWYKLDYAQFDKIVGQLQAKIKREATEEE
jgi:GPH family glycoside/pentoside/hexuronide:cation symporter